MYQVPALFVGDVGGKFVAVGWSLRGHVPLSLCFSEVFEHPVALPTDTVGGEESRRRTAEK